MAELPSSGWCLNILSNDTGNNTENKSHPASVREKIVKMKIIMGKGVKFLFMP